MKKLIAIFLLHVLLFNIGGHLALHQYVTYQSNELYNHQVASNKYNIKDLTEVKIPMSMPGITDQVSYEAVSGRVNFQNASYNYVKLRVTSTGIYLMCVPNYETTTLSTQNIIDAKNINDIPIQKKDHVPFGKIILIAYSHKDVQYRFSTPLIVTFKKVTALSQSHISESVIQGPGQPPDAASLS
ncbi:hypothetical protein ABIB62_001159 [Mucilaginibacter sp. UYP25]|uniref:hypothetical protein n=1 Tax=unclassified Mucilaginibacter TaxID=2617802 RepID=UPI0033984B1D